MRTCVRATAASARPAPTCYSYGSPSLAEQLDPLTGEPLSVSPLTWSHATFVECVMTYLARRSQLEACPTCGLSTFVYSRRGRGAENDEMCP